MKKSDRIFLVIYIIIGGAFMLLGCTTRIEYYSTLMFAMGFALLFNSAAQMIRYHHNTKPENIEAYREKMRKQSIDLKDERKVQLRNRAGYIAWAASLVMCCIAAFVASLLRAEIWVIFIFVGIVVVQYIMATIIYKYLCKKM